MLPSDRERVDGKLQRAIRKANMAAGVLIGLGSTLMETQDEAGLLMNKIAEVIGTVMQRVYVSYGWLLHATFKVWQYSVAINTCLINALFAALGSS